MSYSRCFKCFAWSVIFCSSLILTGCSSGSDTIVEQNQQTYGQQLIDLKAAYDKGILSEREYNKSRDAIVDKMKK
jgi:hypothetical protein